MWTKKLKKQNNKINSENRAFFLRKIDRMLSSGNYDWAEDTLQSIRSSISKSKQVSNKQIDAIHNIARSGIHVF